MCQSGPATFCRGNSGGRISTANTNENVFLSHTVVYITSQGQLGSTLSFTWNFADCHTEEKEKALALKRFPLEVTSHFCTYSVG